MTIRGRFIAAAVGLAALGAGISAARADSVTFATNDTTWTAMGWTTAAGGSLYSGTAVAVDPTNTSWVPSSYFSYGAEWIGVEAGNGSVGYSQEPTGNVNDPPGAYIFTTTLDLVPPPTSPTSIGLNIQFSSDNYLAGLWITDTNGDIYQVPSSTLITLQGGATNEVYSYEFYWNLAGNVGAFTSPVTITAIVQDSLTGSQPDPNNPVGFIASGSLTYQSVPLPAAAEVGFATLAGFGALFAIRRRHHRKMRME